MVETHDATKYVEPHHPMIYASIYLMTPYWVFLRHNRDTGRKSPIKKWSAFTLSRSKRFVWIFSFTNKQTTYATKI